MEHHLRPALICSALLFVLLLGQTADAYSKYGRSCSDIGCLSSETCVMAHDSCSYSQRENKDCGRYPTCRKSGAAGSSPGAALNPMPENTRPVASNYNPNYNTNNNNPISGLNPASAPQNPYPNIYPQIPNGNAQYPQYPNQPYPGQQPGYPGQGYPNYPGQQQPGFPNQGYPNPPPYGGQNPNPYGNQNPYAGGNFPSFPNYRNIPTTTERSLLDQFLYNKQHGYSYRGAAAKTSNVTIFTLLVSLVVTALVRRQY